MASARRDPSPSFRFRVSIGLGTEVGRFSECSGLELEQETFDYKEGGLNSRVHRLPGRFKFGNVTLKKGIATDGDPLWKWVADVVQSSDLGKVKTYDLTVALYDLSGKTELRTWVFHKAYPVKWSATALNAEQNAIAVETLTLAHQGLSFKT
jgi:phage tail-like protein